MTTDRLHYKLQTHPLVREGAPRQRAKQLYGKRKEKQKSTAATTATITTAATTAKTATITTASTTITTTAATTNYYYYYYYHSRLEEPHMRVKYGRELCGTCTRE
jgi:hypothetical protein